MQYIDCPILKKLKRKETPLISKVPIDEYTKMVEKNFDYEFNGESIIYPFELPRLPHHFKILVICGSSGSGKSTLLKEFQGYTMGDYYQYDDSAIVSCFETPQEAANRLSAVGLNSMPVWCRPRKVLSVGEGFRADIALNLENYTIFDEFTSTIDRNVAKSTCNGIHRFIIEHGLHNVVFCSCHKDYIPYLKPDLVMDLDDECIYDCRGKDLGETLPYTSIKVMPKMCGEFLGSITI